MSGVRHFPTVGRRGVFVAAGCGVVSALAGCATVERVETATGMLDSTGAVDLWGIAKGVADVALIADPGLATIVNAAIAIAEPLASDVKSATATASASAASLTAQANALLVATAGVVTVKPNTITAAG